MVANKQALPHLPAGADINQLTYEQLAEWGANIEKATGERKLGFPGGPKGLMHRLFQGSLYPAYTGGVVRTFKNADAEKMWADFKTIWKSTNPRSTSFDFMQEPLLAGDVWVAFDHVARVIDALRQKPDEFVAFPAPSGPKGLGYMPVVAGVAIPKGTPDRASAAQADRVPHPAGGPGHHPSRDRVLPGGQGGPADRSGAGAAAGERRHRASGGAANAIVSLLPVGLGEKNGEFNKVFIDTFQLIVVRNRDIKDSLESQGEKLAGIMQAAGASCWQPDPPSDGPCPVE